MPLGLQQWVENEDNLVIDILHDLIGFGPDGSGKNRLCVSAEDCDSQKCSIQHLP